MFQVVMVLVFVQTEAMLVEIDVLFALMELIQVVGVNYNQMAVMEIAVRIAIAIAITTIIQIVTSQRLTVHLTKDIEKAQHLVKHLVFCSMLFLALINRQYLV